jgi:hypothetical protein|tara:strand:+ start:45405 stop:46016 length:612 start_codon:yes stop_codon:yes gene_type:complete
VLNAERREKRLIELVDRMKAGRTVTKRDLRTVLTDDEFEGYEATWQSVQEYEQMQRETPSDLQRYLSLLRSADALNQRAEKMYAKGKSARYVALAHKAQAQYERAYENLNEALSTNPSLTMWLDRDFSFTTEDLPDLTAEDAPRLRSGRSLLKQGGNSKKMTIKELKLTTLKTALVELIKTPEQKNEKAPSKGTKNILKILGK